MFYSRRFKEYPRCFEVNILERFAEVLIYFLFLQKLLAVQSSSSAADSSLEILLFYLAAL